MTAQRAEPRFGPKHPGVDDFGLIPDHGRYSPDSVIEEKNDRRRALGLMVCEKTSWTDKALETVLRMHLAGAPMLALMDAVRRGYEGVRVVLRHKLPVCYRHNTRAFADFPGLGRSRAGLPWCDRERVLLLRGWTPEGQRNGGNTIPWQARLTGRPEDEVKDFYGWVVRTAPPPLLSKIPQATVRALRRGGPASAAGPALLAFAERLLRLPGVDVESLKATMAAWEPPA